MLNNLTDKIILDYLVQEAMESFAFPDDLLIDEHLEAVDGFMLFWLMLY